MNLSTWNQLKQSLLQQTPSLENRAEHNVYAYRTPWLAAIADTPFDSFRAQYRCHIAQDYCTQVGLPFATVASQLAVTRGVRHSLESLWTLCELQKADSLTLSQGYRSLLNHQQLTSKILAEVQPTSRLSRFLGHAFAGSSDDVRYLWPAEIAWADLLSNRILSIPESLFRPELGPQPSGRAILSSLPVMAQPRP